MSENPLRFLNPDDWRLLSAGASKIEFKPGDEIIRQGSTRQVIYVLRQGTVKVELMQKGSCIQIAKLGTGEVFGEMAFLEDSEASARATAEDNVTVDAIAGTHLYSLFDAFPGLAVRFYQSLSLTLSKRLRYVSAQLVEALENQSSAESPAVVSRD